MATISRLILILMMAGILHVRAADYQMVRIFLKSDADLQRLAEAGIDFEGSRYKKNTFIDLQLSASEKAALESAGFAGQVLIPDLEQFYAGRLETRSGQGFGYGSMGGYYTFDEVMAQLDSMISQFPALISVKDTFGYSLRGRPLVAVKISDNPNLAESEPEVLFTALHHAREPESMMVLLYYMWHLLENYGSDPQITYLVDHRQIWFIPVVNPDGYWHNQQTNPGGGGMWRLNGRDNNDNGVFFEDGIDGVDLNRNYGYQWGYDNSGSSPFPGSQTYRGASPFSEAETYFMKQFCDQHLFTAAFNYHTYSNLLIHPWAYNDSPTPDHFLFHTYGQDLTQFNGYTLGTPGQTVGYAVNGDANDWMYGEQTSKPKIIAYTPEVGNSSDGFWPATSRIIPLARENLYSNIELTYIAGSFPKLAATTLRVFGQNNYLDPGEVAEVTPLVMNYGLHTTGPITVELAPRDAGVHLWNGNAAFPGMGTFDTLTAARPWKFWVDYTVPVGITLKFDILFYENGGLVYDDSLALTVGTPTVPLADDGESGMGQWSTNGQWGLTNASAHSPTHSFTDSPGGNYGNNSDTWIKTPLIDLNQASDAKLSYWTHWDIENSWDFATVEVSTNGFSWTPLRASRMSAASGQGVQVTGTYGYDGQQNDWIYQEIPLDAYTGQSVYLRFRLASDGGITGDGWYLDDIKITLFGQNSNRPPYLPSATNLGTQVFTGLPYPVQAVILDEGGIDSAAIYYSLDNGQTFAHVLMNGTDSLFSGHIPALAPNTSVHYYIQAVDSAGAWARYPYNAPDSTLVLQIIGSGPAISVAPAQLDFTVPQFFWQEKSLVITNPGNQTLTYQITDSTVSMPTGVSPHPPIAAGRVIARALVRRLHRALQKTEMRGLPGRNARPAVPAISPTIVIQDSAGDVSLPGVDILSIDFSSGALSNSISISFAAPPDSQSLGILPIDLDQNFGTGMFPAPFGFGLGNFDLGSEYEIYLDFANILGDTLGLPASAYVLDMSDTSLVGLPVPLQINGSQVTAEFLKFLYPIFDDDMNLGMLMLPLRGHSLPDAAPDFGHGLYGTEKGCSWVATFDSAGVSSDPVAGSLAPGDSARYTVKVAAAYPVGAYQAALKITGNSAAGGVEVPINVTVIAPGQPAISVMPSAIADTLPENGPVSVYPLEISNSGSQALIYAMDDTLFDGSNWLEFSQTYGSVLPGLSAQPEIMINPAGLLPGNHHQGEIRIYSNDPANSLLTVPVDIFVEPANAISRQENIPRKLALYPNFPNPFNPETEISFDLPGKSRVNLEVFNILGQRVAVLVNRVLPAGHHRFKWNARESGGQPAPSGIYFYRLRAANKTVIRKMLLTR